MGWLVGGMGGVDVTCQLFPVLKNIPSRTTSQVWRSPTCCLKGLGQPQVKMIGFFTSVKRDKIGIIGQRHFNIFSSGVRSYPTPTLVVIRVSGQLTAPLCHRPPEHWSQARRGLSTHHHVQGLQEWRLHTDNGPCPSPNLTSPHDIPEDSWEVHPLGDFIVEEIPTLLQDLVSETSAMCWVMVDYS